MKNGIRAICFALALGLALLMAGCSKKKEPTKPQDLESARANLREQVASGGLTKEEAVVKLAEATKEAKFGSKGKDKPKRSPALEALGEKLKEQVVKGELTAEEAKAAWMEAAKKGKTESSAKGTEDSVKKQNERKEAKAEFNKQASEARVHSD